MKRSVVVDASVAVRWVVRGSDWASAVAVLLEKRDDLVELEAPAIQPAEVANALAKYARFGRMSAEQVRASFAEYLALAPRLYDTRRLARSAFDLALAHRWSVYDCLYLALSLELRCDLLTADAKLFRALGPAYPSIRLVGAPKSDAQG